MAALAEVPRSPLVALAVEIRIEAEAAERSWRDALGHAIRAGELLAEAKAQVRHGEWLSWLRANFDGSERTARNYMRLAANRQTVAVLDTVTDALETLATPKAPPEPPEPPVCGWSHCTEAPTHFTRPDADGCVVAPMPERAKTNPNAGGYCLEHAEANQKFHNDAAERRRAEPPMPSHTSRPHGEPYGIPPRDRRLRNPNVTEKPHPKGLFAEPGPWVVECACCGHDLYAVMGDDDTRQYERWAQMATAGLPTTLR